jgi:hypothetical protein
MNVTRKRTCSSILAATSLNLLAKGMRYGSSLGVTLYTHIPID